MSSWSFSYITYDTLNQSYFSKEAIFFTITTAIAGVIIDSFAMRNLTDETVMLARTYMGKPNEVEILRLKKSLDNFYKIISGLSQKEFLVFKEMIMGNSSLSRSTTVTSLDSSLSEVDEKTNV